MNTKNCCNTGCSYVTLHICKIDAASGAGIPGAVFELTASNGLVCSGMTDPCGALQFKLLPCAAYTLREAAAPGGYTPGSHVYNISVDACGGIFADGAPISKLVITNTPITAAFTAIKVNIENGVRLAGAVYTLYMNASVIASAVSNAAGQVVFMNLAPGTYELVETTPPPGFRANAERLTVVAAKDGSVTINGQPANGFVLGDSPLSEFIFRKSDAGTGLPLSGAAFALAQNGTVIGAATSDANGLVSFGPLAAGTYLLSETLAPPGFQPNSAVYQVTAYPNGAITVDGVLLDDFVVGNNAIAISAPPVINTVVAGSTVVTGMGIPGSAVTVTLPSGSTLSTTVNAGGAWTVNVPTGLTLAIGDIVSANQTEPGKLASVDVYTIVIDNDDVEPGIDIFVENLSTGLSFATAGDVLLYDAIVTNNGTPSSVWQSPYVTFSLSGAVTLQTSSIRINNRVPTSGQYSYDSTANTLTVYPEDIPGGGGVSVSYRVTVVSDISDIHEIVLDIILGSLV